MTAIVMQLNAGLRRAACPLVLPRLVGALVAAWCDNLYRPIHVAAAAVDGYAEAHKAVLRVLP